MFKAMVVRMLMIAYVQVSTTPYIFAFLFLETLKGRHYFQTLKMHNITLYLNISTCGEM